MDSQERVNPETPDSTEPQSVKDWLRGNSIMLMIVGAGLLFLAYKLARGDADLSTLANIAKVVIGLSFVVFLHELGHFLVAKWCDVQVDVFSIGFGPALPGCNFKWGETTYKIALLPLGGYVKMLGQVDGDEHDDPENDDNPRSYKNKSVGQRMAIISAGVLMNVILACICFIAVYTHGVKRTAAVVGRLDAAGQAWKHGIPSGAVITQVGDSPGMHPPTFMDLTRAALRSREGEKVTLIYRLPPDTEEYRADVEPRAGDGRPVIGISPANSAELPPRSALGGLYDSPVEHNSPAAAARAAFDLRPGDTVVATTDPDNPDVLSPLPANDRQQNLFELSQRWQRRAGRPLVLQVRRAGAKPGDAPEEIRAEPAAFQFEDKIVATTDPDDPRRVTDLPPDTHTPETGLGDSFELRRRFQRLAGEVVTIRVRRASGQTADLMVPPAYHHTFGARMAMGEIAAVRENSPAEAAGVRKGNFLQKTVLTDANGASKSFMTAHTKKETAADIADFVDPLQLPDALRRWAEGRAGVKAVLYVVRANAQTGDERDEPKPLPAVAWDEHWRYDVAVPINLTSAVAVPELGLAYQVETMVEIGPGDDTLEDDDVIKQIRFRERATKAGASAEGRWTELGHDQWAHASYFLQHLADDKTVTVKVERKKKGARDARPELVELELTARQDPAWPAVERGLLLADAPQTVKADHFGAAVVFGMLDTRDQILDVLYNLRGMFLQRISPTGMVGPLGIANIAFRVAKVDLWEFLFFIGMISVNLAVINFLPIPLLDGGHMVFLTYEKLRGRPASEQVRVAATYMGLLFILFLFVFASFLDFRRMFF